jgi:hypothetical protein
VLNLTTFEGLSNKDEVDFLRRYVKLTHCDLFSPMQPSWSRGTSSVFCYLS